MTKHEILHGLYLIFDPSLTNRNPLRIAEEVLDAGTDILQLRWKDMPVDEVSDLSKELLILCSRYNVPFIINDYTEIIDELKQISLPSEYYWGLHLGQDDMSIDQARKNYGNDLIIGISAHNKEQMVFAQENKADYIGFGAVFPTQTKKDAQNHSINSLENLKSDINIPIFLIGGINETNIHTLISKGYKNICVSSAIMCSNNPGNTTSNLKKIISKDL